MIRDNDEWPGHLLGLNAVDEVQARLDKLKERFNEFHDNALDEMLSFKRDDVREAMDKAHQSALEHFKSKGKLIANSYAERYEQLKSKGKLAESSAKNPAPRDPHWMPNAQRDVDLRDAKIAAACDRISRKAEIFYATTIRLDKGLTEEEQREVHRAKAFNRAYKATVHTGERMNLAAIYCDEATFQTHLKELANLYKKR